MRHVVLDLLPIIGPLGIAFITILGVKTFLGVTFGGVFLTLGGMVLPFHAGDKSSADIGAGPVKVKWEGPASLALFVVGVLMLILGLYAFFESHKII
jgi:hypothetical protein